MTESVGVSNNSPPECLLRILKMGGQITKAPQQIFFMLNGLRYYSVEVTLNQNCYNIQAYEQDAVELYNMAMLLFDCRDTGIRNIENILRKNKGK